MKNNLKLTLNNTPPPPPPKKKKKKKKEEEIDNGQQSIHLNLPTPKIAIFSENPKNTEIRNVDSKTRPCLCIEMAKMSEYPLGVIPVIYMTRSTSEYRQIVEREEVCPYI